MYWHFNTNAAPPSSQRPGIPAYLDRLVLGLLAKDPTQRPPSAATVAQILRPGATQQPPAATTSWLPPKSAKKSRRGLVAAGTALLLALVAAGAFVGLSSSGAKPKPRVTVPADIPLAAVNGKVPGQAAPGETLTIGRRAIVPLPQPNGTTDVAGVTVTSLTAGTAAQLKKSKLFNASTAGRLYIVHFTVTNLGAADPDLNWNFSEDFGGVLVDGSTRISESVGYSIPGCGSLTVNNASFIHGATYNGCALLNPLAEQGAVIEVVWVAPPYGDPIGATGAGVIWK